MRLPQSKAQQPSLNLEHALRDSGLLLVAGVDEAGRGAWAGPVVAAAVILPLEDLHLADILRDVRDSKLMTPTQRRLNYARIQETAISIGVGEASSEEVDSLNIIGATRQAMRRAIGALSIPPQYILLDHLELPDLEIAQTAITKGDRDVLSIAAASIVAKVFRDEIMMKLDERYPLYGFSNHKGYGTPHHRKALLEFGPSLIHRKTFHPIADQNFKTI